MQYNLYESKRRFALKLAEAFERRGVKVDLVDFQDKRYKDGLCFKNTEMPDFACSFNRVAPDSKGRFFWDKYQLPYLSILVDPAYYDAFLIHSPCGFISCVDLMDCEFLRKKGYERAFFWPHAVERELGEGRTEDRPYDVVFIGSSYDPDSLRNSWKDRFTPQLCKIMENAAELCLSQIEIPFWEAVSMALSEAKMGCDQADLRTLCNEVDLYVRGVDRLELIRSVKNAKIHVFGGTCWRNLKPILGWSHYFAGNSNVIVHPAISFDDSLEILKRSKICLNSMPFFKNGTHERIFTGLACGSLPVTTENLWVQNNFHDNKDLLYYRSKNWEEVDEKIQFFLKHENERRAIVEAGREKVMKYHTWDCRVDELLQILPKT